MNQLTSLPRALRRKRAGRPGFTLLELIVVITVIGVLASLVVMRVSNVGPRARRTKIDSDMKTVLRVAEAIKAETGRYPETITDMINPTDATGAPLAASLDSVPLDPWQQEYIYEIYDGRPSLLCLGSDMAEGGEDEAQDVRYPEEDDFGGY